MFLQSVQVLLVFDSFLAFWLAPEVDGLTHKVISDNPAYNYGT